MNWKFPIFDAPKTNRDRILTPGSRYWPAPGSEDTELGVSMEPEVDHGEAEFTREFKLEAVRLIKERGVSYAQASQDLGVHTSQLRDWVTKFADDPQHAFPGQGQTSKTLCSFVPTSPIARPAIRAIIDVIIYGASYPLLPHTISVMRIVLDSARSA